MRTAAVEDATEIGGALGISRRIEVEADRARGVAIRAPPAEIFRTDASSRNGAPV